MPNRVAVRPPARPSTAIGDSAAAFIAGASPSRSVADRPTSARNASARQSMPRSRNAGLSAGASIRTIAGATTEAKGRASAHAISESTPPSMSTCWTRRAATGADRQTQRHLPHPRRRAGEQQVRHVRSRHQEHETDDGGENPERPLEVAPQHRRPGGRRANPQRRLQEPLEQVARGVGREGPRAIVERLGEGGLERSVNVRRLDAGRQASHHPEPRPAGIGERGGGEHGRRHPHVDERARLDTGEPGAGDADDLEGVPGERDRPAERRRRAAKPPLPVGVAHDRDRMRAGRHIVGRRQQPSDRGPESQRREHGAGDVLHAEPLLLPRIIGCGRGLPEIEAGGKRDRPVTRPPRAVAGTADS